MLVWSGIISLLTSDANVTLSSSSLPKVKSPVVCILPVACNAPVIFQSLWIFTVPFPFGRSSILVSVVVVLIVLKSNFKFSSINNDEILKHKNDNDSIWYWVTKWKDYMIDFIKEIKPTPPSNISSNLYPLSILTSVVDMIPRWVVKEKINLYILKFKFKKPKEDINIKYLSESLYKSCYRCNIDDNPCVHPF